MTNSLYRYKLTNRLFVLLFCAFFSNLWLQAQNPFTQTASTVLTVGDANYSAYTARFDFTEKEIKKGLWKYCKGFGQLVNMRTYYEINIPSALNEGNVDLKLFSEIEGEENRIMVSFALDTAGLKAVDIATYDTQCQNLLKDFKITFYNGLLQEKIDKATKEAARLSKRYAKIADSDFQEEKQTFISQIDALEKQISAWRNQQLKNAQ